ncbi:RNA12 protein-domain-containing protein [Massariosphaeria phaeospora]|uniref:Mitochondrial escape protein 2 n=1 Tax=Massariosphaeria phaeospora TaxID=100035 RepID=A0A7C8IFG1_9PLEO|nr:RNA12 protein-domain-containing protein [Massariosphaeria phaeospora]
MLLKNGWHRAVHRNPSLARTGLVARTSLAATQRHWAVNGRYASVQAGENKTGHINAGANEGILFFNNVFPLKIQKLLGIPFTSKDHTPRFLNYIISPSITGTDPTKIIENASTKANISIQATNTLLRLKEGGAFVKFTHDGSTPDSELEKVLKQYLKENPVKPWWSPFRKMQVNLVKGRPWVEDMFRLPTSRIKVEFIPSEPGEEAVELSQEQLYAFFRPYGKLADIKMQPPDSKVLPKSASLDFARMQKAIMARNCMHGYLVTEAEGGGKKGTVLRLTYEQKIKPHWIRDWLVNHPRIVIPIIAALVATITVAVFDPIRTWFVKAHITRSLHIQDNAVYQWIKGYATDIIRWNRKDDDDSGMEAIWDDRKGNIEQIQTWLMETADTFIIVQGPRGSGKRELVVDQALKDKKDKVIIDCKPIQEARGDSATINAAAAQVGYRPVFSWMNSISGMVDMAAQGATGVKTGFSETVDSQLSKIWNNTTTALRQIALENRHKQDKDAHLGDDEWLEAHPERRPVVIIDNFLHKSQEGGMVYEKIADWAARLTTANIAHVVFLTNDVSYSKSLSKALPDRVFRQIGLSDCSPEVAKKFVINHLDADVDDDPPLKDGSPKELPSQTRTDLGELDTCIDLLGGRLTDLEFLARRIKTGETPTKAVNEIIDQSASEILKMYLFGSNDDGSARKWNSEQAWLLIKQLAANDTLRYNEIILSDTYKSGGEAVLHALEQAELISVVSGPNGRPASIKAGKPVYHSAFKRLTEDHVLKSKLDLAILTDLTKVENATIEKCENELLLLSKLKSQPAQMMPRIQYLLAKLAASQEKVERYEGEGKVLKKVLGEEY